MVCVLVGASQANSHVAEPLVGWCRKDVQGSGRLLKIVSVQLCNYRACACVEFHANITRCDIYSWQISYNHHPLRHYIVDIAFLIVPFLLSTSLTFANCVPSAPTNCWISSPPTCNHKMRQTISLGCSLSIVFLPGPGTWACVHCKMCKDVFIRVGKLGEDTTSLRISRTHAINSASTRSTMSYTFRTPYPEILCFNILFAISYFSI